MNNNEFTYIKEVAKQKSFSKASKALGISQPALSNYIKKLEDRTGVLLFDRSISPIEITEFGKAYLEYAEDVISATDRLKKRRNKNRKCCMFFNNIFAGTNVSLPQEISGNYF